MHEIKQSRFDFFRKLILGLILLLPFSSLFANKLKTNTKVEDEKIPDIKFQSISKEEADELIKQKTNNTGISISPEAVPDNTEVNIK